MMLTDLAAAVRASGLPVIEVPGWKTRGHGQMTAVDTIVCHHTAGPAKGNYPSLSVVRDGRADLPGPLAQLGLARDGTVYVIAAGVAYHAGVVKESSYDNWHAIGIEAEATGVDPWPEAQLDAYARLCAALCARYRLPVARVLGHKEVCSPSGRKVDPNFDMPAFRNRVDAALHPAKEKAVSKTPNITEAIQRGVAYRKALAAINFPSIKAEIDRVSHEIKGLQDLLRSVERK